MINPYVILLTTLSWFIAYDLYGQTVPISDPNFKQYLIDNGYDTTPDGDIDSTEALDVHVMSMYNLNISNLNGLGAFTSLTHLDVSLNNIDSIDVSNNTQLKYLKLDNNLSLDELDISSLTDLNYLNVSYTSLSELSLAQNGLLDSLFCYFGSIDTLEITNNPHLRTVNCHNSGIDVILHGSLDSLRYLDCSYNNLSYLDVTSAQKLHNLNCYSNELVQLNVAGLPELYLLDCTVNNLSSLDVSGCSNLFVIGCENNQLSSITCGNNVSLYSINMSQNEFTDIGDLTEAPNLYQIFASYNLFENISVVNPSLEQLYLNDNALLYSLDICQSDNIKYLDLTHMPQSITVNVWSLPFPYAGVTTSEYDSPNIAYVQGNCPLSVAENQTSIKLELYPNPVSSALNIEVSNPNSDQLEFNILDLTGKVISSLISMSENTVLDFSLLEKGCYVVNISGPTIKEERLVCKV